MSGNFATTEMKWLLVEPPEIFDDTKRRLLVVALFVGPHDDKSVVEAALSLTILNISHCTK
jgi:hypothetical protein